MLEELHCWYEPNQELRERILLSIRQFERDLAAYVPPEVIEKPVAEVIMQLPAVVINATGGLSVCNLRDITPEFDFFLSGANTVLVTDSDFVNADSTAKFSRTTAKTLKLKAKEVVDQIATVSEAVRTLELYAEKFDSLGLKLEKLVKSEKEARKLAILSEVRTAYYAHVAALEVETAPIKLNIAVTDFAVHMKGLQKLDSVQNAVNTALANAKIAADATAKDIRGKLAWFTANVSEDRATMNFRDLHEIIRKPMDDFQLVVCTRQEQVAKAEADKLEAQRVQMQAEADAKAKAAQDAILAAERTKMEAEVRAKAVEEAKERAKTEAIIRAVETTGTAFIDGDKVLSGKDIFAEPNPQAASQIGIIGKMPDLTPSRDLIIKTVSRAFNVDEGTAYQWLRNAFAEVAA